MQFRFQRILELKERVEQTRKAALGEAVAAMEVQRGQLASLVDAKKMHTAAPRAESGKAVDAGLLALDASYGQRLEREIGEQFEEVRQSDVVVDERRTHLLAASKERRVFEILKERVVNEYRRERRRQEKIELDETGAKLHQRREQAE